MAAAGSTFAEPTGGVESFVEGFGASETEGDDDGKNFDDVEEETREDDVWFETGRFRANLMHC